MRCLVLHIFICSLLLSGCNVQKRKYQKGYYFAGSHSATQRSRSQTGLTDLYKIPTDDRNPGSAGSGFAFSRARLLKADSCDVIVFNDGTEIKARVVELDDRILRYRFCDDDPKIRTANRMQLVRIKYANGSIVEMKVSAVPSPTIVPEEFPKSQTVATSPTPSSSVQPTTVPAPLERSDTTIISKKPCDRILFRDGSEEWAKVTEIGLTEVRYKSCTMPNGPDFVKMKSSIFFVEYANGQKEVFRQEPVANEEPVYRKRVVKRNGQAISAFIFSLLSIYPMWIVGSIIALSMAIPYLSKHKKDPETYDQPGLARTAIIIASITLGLVAFFLIMGAFI